VTYHIPTVTPEAMGETAWKAFLTRLAALERK